MLTYLGTGDFWMTLVSGLLFHENNYMMSHSYDATGIMIFKPPTTKQDKVHVSTVEKKIFCKIWQVAKPIQNI
jgi:hypothetical protein